MSMNYHKLIIYAYTSSNSHRNRKHRVGSETSDLDSDLVNSDLSPEVAES